jgi:hypothetical protein
LVTIVYCVIFSWFIRRKAAQFHKEALKYIGPSIEILSRGTSGQAESGLSHSQIHGFCAVSTLLGIQLAATSALVAPLPVTFSQPVINWHLQASKDDQRTTGLLRVDGCDRYHQIAGLNNGNLLDEPSVSGRMILHSDDN